MKINNEIYFHIHKENRFSDLWYKGNKLNFTEREMNNFNLYYNDYFPKILINNIKYPVLKAMEILNNSRLYSDERSAEYIINLLHSTTKELSIYMREIIFEEIRQENFLNLPSRKSCIWVCEKESVQYWLNTLGLSCKIFKLELTGVIHKADQSHLQAEVLPCNILRENAIKYWTGTDGNNIEEQEILFEGIVNIIDEFEKIEDIR